MVRLIWYALLQMQLSKNAIRLCMFDCLIWFRNLKKEKLCTCQKQYCTKKIRKTDFTDNRWVAIATNYRVFLQLFAWNLWKAKRFKYRHVYSLRTIWMAQQTWRKCPGGIGNRQNSAQLRWYCVRWSEHESLYKSNKDEVKQRRGGDAA